MALDCTLDHWFPRYTPNSEDMAMVHIWRCLANRADVGLDDDGDRCGVVNDEGRCSEAVGAYNQMI
jgi:phosphomannomutase / phosphoglucomutase